MTVRFGVWRRRIAELIKPAFGDFGTVLLGIAVVFFTRAFPSVYLDNVNFGMLAVSIIFCLAGLSLRLYSRSDDAD